jgi:curved DNA-binding protein CbpA
MKKLKRYSRFSDWIAWRTSQQMRGSGPTIGPPPRFSQINQLQGDIIMATATHISFFGKITSFDDLRSQYRRLAMQHHPDCGGNSEDMKLLNAEYDSLFRVWNPKKASAADYETASKDINNFYRENGWTGENFNGSLWKTDLTAIFRKYVKRHYPYCKFSITVKHYSSIYINLMEAPFSPFAKIEDIQEEIDCMKQRNNYYSAEERMTLSGYGINHYHMERDFHLSAVCKAIMKDVLAFANSYNYDYSDTQSDYFATNFYLTLQIGKWDKPFVQKGKMEIADTEDICAA